MSIYYKIKGAFDQLLGTGDDRVAMLFSSGSGKAKISYLSAYEKSLYVNKALEKRATKVGEIKFTVKSNGKDVVNSNFLKLLNKPNKDLTKTQFFEAWQKHKDIYGQVFVWKKRNVEIFNNNITELELLLPSNVSMKIDDTGDVVGYVYTNSQGKATEFKKDEIIYDHRPDPKDLKSGVSLLKAGITAIANSLEIEDLQHSILKNGGKVDTVISFKSRETISQKQSEDLRGQYNEKYKESKRNGEPLFLAGDPVIHNLGLTPAELGYLEGKKMTLADLCILTEVPKSLLGVTEDSTFNNADASLRIFLRETIYPAQKSIADVLNSDKELTKENETIEVVDPTPENNEEVIKAIESGLSKGYITINEAREKIKKEPVENGDDILISFSSMPLSELYQENTPVNADDKKKSLNHPLKDASFRRLYHKNFIKRADRHEKAFKRSLNSYFLSQKARILEKILANKSYTKSNASDYFDMDIEVAIGQKRLMQLMLDIAQESGQSAIRTVGSKADFNLNAGLHSWIEQKSDIFLRQINETTLKQLNEEFVASLEANESFGDLAKRINRVYGDITTSRAYTIARTETNGIMGKATLQGYEQVGMTIKIWVAVMDKNTRDSHANLDGQEQPINSPFTNGLMFPSDPSGSPAETINCRCSI